MAAPLAAASTSSAANANANETNLNFSNQNLKIERLENELSNVKNQLQLVESKMDTLIRQNEALLLAQAQQQLQSSKLSQANASSANNNNNSINSNAQLSKTDLENLFSRLTIVETEILVRKQQVNIFFNFFFRNINVNVLILRIQRDHASKIRTRQRFTVFWIRAVTWIAQWLLRAVRWTLRQTVMLLLSSVQFRGAHSTSHLCLRIVSCVRACLLTLMWLMIIQ